MEIKTEWTWYYENGQIKLEENLKITSKVDGLYITSDIFMDDEFNGKWIDYYENGQIRNEENYKDGNEDGKWTWYFENGQKRKL